ncbi:MAG: hypothetical protein HC880_12765 [Bacteroidia bacterium]|nr:hypothetical protein [Bacteroidia bacterium]
MPEFEETAIALKNVNDFSEPVRTRYGWHLIKLVARKPIPSLEQTASTLKQEVSKDSRYARAQQAMIQKIKDIYQFKEFPEVINRTLALADERLAQGAWSYNSSDPLMNGVLFSLEDKRIRKPYTVADFLEYVYLSQVQKSGPPLPNSSCAATTISLLMNRC